MGLMHWFCSVIDKEELTNYSFRMKPGQVGSIERQESSFIVLAGGQILGAAPVFQRFVSALFLMGWKSRGHCRGYIGFTRLFNAWAVDAETLYRFAQF